MRIGELADRAGVSARSLRYYEEQGLLHSRRSASGQRHYDEAAVERVRLLQQLYAAGLASRTILELMPCIEAPVERYTPLVLARLVRERDRITAQVAELLQTREQLDQVITTASALPFSEPFNP